MIFTLTHILIFLMQMIIMTRLQNAVGKSHKTTLFTLIVLETCVKNCGKPFHLLVSLHW